MDARDQPISDIMTSPVRSVTAETPADEVATILADEGIGSVVVTDANGIVTKTDLLAGFRSGQLEIPASELMTQPVVTVRRDADIQTAIDRMHEYEIKRLVVENTTETVGIVTTTDIRQALATEDDSAIRMFTVSGGSDGDNMYECMSCGKRVSAARKPGTCNACDAPLRNLSVSRD
jgi:signal-transduction protein with cAMP-binding, CBS, and nucleotidyltransferase domain